MLTQREVKYTSAAPRCTCLPPRQHCAGVALGSPLPTPQHCWFGRRTSTTRLRLVVLASSSSTMLWSCTRCPPDSTAMLILRKDKYTSAAPRCTYLPPHQHCTEVALGGQQVHLGYASVYLLSSSCNFSTSTPRQSSSTPRLRLGVLELGLSVLERSQPSTPPPAVVLIPLVSSKKTLLSCFGQTMSLMPLGCMWFCIEQQKVTNF